MLHTAVAPAGAAASAPSLPTAVELTQSSSVASRLSALSKRSHRYKRLGKYYLGQTIGEGEFGKVKLAWAEDDNGVKKQYAVKLLRQDKFVGIDESQKIKVYHEINALQACRHPHIIRLENVLRNENYIGIILAYASGGDMFTQIHNNGPLEERCAQKLFAQLVSGVNYLHQKGIVHRDLKLENLLLDSNQNILISDFGFANSFRTKNGFQLMKTSCGSPCYAAPEVVHSNHSYDGRKADIWSLGVILFTFVAGYLPFDDDPENPESEDIQLLYRYITTTPLKFPDSVRSQARDLLRMILVQDPERRAKMPDIMAHPWLEAHRQFLSITPAEHEGSAPWQRRAPARAAEPRRPDPRQRFSAAPEHTRPPSRPSAQPATTAHRASAAMPARQDITGVRTSRLAQAAKPRPISYQLPSSGAFELAEGPSLYTPRAPQPRVGVNREPSKSGEISRPQHRHAASTSSAFVAAHSSSSSASSNFVSAAASAAMAHAPPTPPSPTSVAAARPRSPRHLHAPQRHRRAESQIPRSVSVTTQLDANRRASARLHVDEKPMSSASRIKSRLSSALWYRSSRSESAHSPVLPDGFSAELDAALAEVGPLREQQSRPASAIPTAVLAAPHTVLGASPDVATMGAPAGIAPIAPPSAQVEPEVHPTLDPAAHRTPDLSDRSAPAPTGPTPGAAPTAAPQPAATGPEPVVNKKRASHDAYPTPESHHVPVIPPLQPKERAPSAIPVKSTGSNFKRMTLNLFKRRSMA